MRNSAHVASSSPAQLGMERLLQTRRSGLSEMRAIHQPLPIMASGSTTSPATALRAVPFETYGTSGDSNAGRCGFANLQWPLGMRTTAIQDKVDDGSGAIQEL
eukprot:5403223-Amphidinium_carterae.1